MVTFTAVPHTPWWMRLIQPIFRLRPRREHSSPMTTHGRILRYLAAGGIISTADDLATWIRALVGGKVFNADYQSQWMESPEPEDPSNPKGQKYGYGISLIDLRAEQSVFSRRRDARLQLLHGLRSSQRCHADNLDQPDPIA